MNSLMFDYNLLTHSRSRTQYLFRNLKTLTFLLVITSNPQKRNRVILMIHLSKKRTNPLAHLLVVIDREDNINEMQYTRKMPSNTELKLAVIVTKTIFTLKCIIMLCVNRNNLLLSYEHIVYKLNLNILPIDKCKC